MKTVSGKVVSCQQISLSRAAKYLSRFTASDNEASPAFAAYLRRTSAAFNELVQLHKEYKIPLGKFKYKKDHSTGIVSQGTANSVKIAGKNGLPATDIQISGKGIRPDEGVCEGIEVGLNIDKDSRNVERRDSASVGIGLEVQNGGSTVEGDVPDVDGGLKKSKKKRGRDGDVAAAKDKLGGDHEAIKVDDVMNEMRSLDGSEEMKKNVPDVGGVGKKSKKKRGSDGDVAFINKVKPNGVYDGTNVSEIKNEMGSLDASEEVKNSVPDGGDTGKKSKKKRGNDDLVSFIEKDQSHDAINPNEVKNKMGSLDASEDMKNKKKNKRNKHEKENHDGASETMKAVQLHPHRHGHDTGEAADTVQNNGDEQKKHKKKSKVKDVKESSSIKSSEQKDDRNVRNEVKEERESSSIRSVEQRREINVENKGEVIGEKKQSHEAEGRENGRNMETEAAGKKGSRKRKHERVADAELDGSQEAVRPKKKKI